ncbi:gap junction delta-4 protein [Betta splendens]|uniref:Gap junction protein n=1 Tax=Betta splendens TaxID=158456 RepID=A0A6P7MHD5_BETSP|nr:gap junction delta-4 protein [Betta splendens]
MWIIVMIFLRILVLLFAGYPLYQDEQERFVCNTIQPGCANVCYDLFSHVSLFRFWVVQLIALCLPYIIFVIYVVHKVSNSLTVDLKPFSKNHQKLFSQTPTDMISPAVEQGGWTWRFTGTYILQLIFRILLEAAFGTAHYYLFGFSIPRRFLCQQSPCTTQVDCYISRPTEKTVMLNFMLAVAALSLVLNLLDFICIVKCSLRQKRKRKVMVENIYEEEQCSLTADKSASLAQQDLERLSVTFRKRQGSGGSCSGREALCLEISSLPHSSGPSVHNSNGNNGYYVAQVGAQERNGSEVAASEQLGTPRSFCVNKRSLLKPPPPPRRGTEPGPIRGITTVTTIRRNSHCEATDLQTFDDEQDKKSHWV